MRRPLTISLADVAMLGIAILASVNHVFILNAFAADGNFRVGASVVDITPLEFPVIVNGMFEERTADRAVDPLYARAFVLDDAKTRIAMVVVDSCMVPRELLDEAKTK